MTDWTDKITAEEQLAGTPNEMKKEVAIFTEVCNSRGKSVFSDYTKDRPYSIFTERYMDALKEISAHIYCLDEATYASVPERAATAFEYAKECAKLHAAGLRALGYAKVFSQPLRVDADISIKGGTNHTPANISYNFFAATSDCIERMNKALETRRRSTSP